VCVCERESAGNEALPGEIVEEHVVVALLHLGLLSKIENSSAIRLMGRNGGASKLSSPSSPRWRPRKGAATFPLARLDANENNVFFVFFPRGRRKRPILKSDSGKSSLSWPSYAVLSALFILHCRSILYHSLY